MPNFHYQVKNPVGETIEADLEAKDKNDAVKMLKSRGFTVVLVKENTGNSWNVEKINILLSRVSLREKIVFTRNMSSMISAGISAARALEILEKQTKNPKFKNVLFSLRQDIEQGKTISDSMKRFPEVFSSLFVAMVHSGEETGNIVDAFKTVGTQLDQNYTLRKKIKGAMMYPSIVIFAMIVIGILMFIYVVPSLTSTFKEFNMDLPMSTKMIMWVSDFLVTNLALALTLIVSLFLGVFFGLRTKRGAVVSDFISLHFPVINGIVKQYNAAQTTRTLSSLFSSGVNIIDALSITEDVLQNSYYKQVLSKAKDAVQKGIPLSSVFIQHEDIYPIMVGEMMQVGEETGKLSEMLGQIASFYEDEVTAITKDLSTVIEPILMLFIASAVGFFAVSMITPMYKLASAI